MRNTISLLAFSLLSLVVVFQSAVYGKEADKKDIAAPVLFVANGGQWPQSVLFGARQGNTATYLEKTIITTQLFQTNSKGVVIKARFLDADEQLSVRGEKPTKSKFNFLKGTEKDWKTGISAYERVLYKNLYAGIDMEASSNKNGVEQHFILHKDASPDTIRVKVEGVKKLTVNDNGELVMDTELGDVVQSAPSVFRLKGKTREKLDVRYEIVDNVTYKLSR